LSGISISYLLPAIELATSICFSSHRRG